MKPITFFTIMLIVILCLRHIYYDLWTNLKIARCSQVWEWEGGPGKFNNHNIVSATYSTGYAQPSAWGERGKKPGHRQSSSVGLQGLGHWGGLENMKKLPVGVWPILEMPFHTSDRTGATSFLEDCRRIVDRLLADCPQFIGHFFTDFWMQTPPHPQKILQINKISGL